MKLLYKTLIIGVVISVFGCTEEIPLDAVYQPQVFILGAIDNETDIVYINIKQTLDVSSTTPKPINTAAISLYTKGVNDDNETLITDQFIVNNGDYTSQTAINPIEGNLYWAEITLDDGTILKSDIEILKPPVQIHSVTRDNMQTKVTFSDPANDRNFYMITYRALDDFDNELYAEFIMSTDILFDGNDDAFVEIDDTFGSRVEVSILNLNFNTFQFFSNVLAQLDSQEDDSDGTDPSQLFASPPANLTGNVSNTKTGRRVLGNFGVSGISSMTVNF